MFVVAVRLRILDNWSSGRGIAVYLYQQNSQLLPEELCSELFLYSAM